MREEFYVIYEEAYTTYPDVFSKGWRFSRELREMYPNPDLPLEIALEAIERCLNDNEQPRPIRPDARHFLLVNLHQMVALPLLLAHRQRDVMRTNAPKNSVNYINTGKEEQLKLPEDFVIKLKDDLAQDAAMIIEDAMKSSQSDSITGHAILNSLAKKYDQLCTTKFQLWG